MVSQIINVIVNSRGAVTVRKQLTQIGDSARTTTTYLNSLRAVLAAALTFSGVGAITRVSDEFIAMSNRLRLVSDESNTVADSWNRLLGIANETYSAIGPTVDLYYRVAQAYKAWGESAESAYEFTELFQKSAILSGSTMQTTAQAVYQFSQALNKGKLDGDEFRSVLEGLPYVAKIIQDELGVTRAELYEMSADGKISLDRIKAAFENAADTIRSDWGSITPTIGMALNVLRNNWTDFIGDIQNSTGIFTGLAYLILLVANNFDVLAVAMLPVAASFAWMAGRMGIGLLVMGFRDMMAVLIPLTARVWAFTYALLSNPLTAIPTMIALAVAALIYFRNEIGLTNQTLLLMWEWIKNVFNTIIEFVSPVTSAFAAVASMLGEWLLSFDMIRAVVSVTWADILAMFSSITAAIGKAAAFVKASFVPVWENLKALAREYVELVTMIVNLYVEALSPAVSELYDVFKRVWDYIQPALQKFVNFLNEVWQGWVNIATYLSKEFLPIVKHVFEGWIVIINGVINVIRTLIDALKFALSLMSKVGAGGGGGGGSPGMNYGGQFYAGEFASGGQFNVGGTGAGRDTTPVAFRANRGERVTVETKRQQRQADNGNSAPSVNVPVQVVNVFDPNMVPMAMESAAGQRSFLNLMVGNRDEVLNILGAR